MTAPDTPLRWLTRPRRQGVTWGVPWPRGAVRGNPAYRLLGDRAEEVPVQSWTTARWPDGSVKWSAHAINAGPVAATGYRLLPAEEPGPVASTDLSVEARPDGIRVDTGRTVWWIPGPGPEIISRAEAGGRTAIGPVRLVSRWQDVDEPAVGSLRRASFTGMVEEVGVEQDGPVRAVIRIRGRHRPDGDDRPSARLPFDLRLVFYAGAEEVRLVHTIIWDRHGDEPADDLPFLAGLGIRAEVIMTGPLYDRHIRLAGPAGEDTGDDHRPGFLSEAVRGLTGLRRDPGAAVRSAQISGRPCPPLAEWAPEVSRRLDLIPAWSDWTLDQHNPDGFTLAKRTAEGYAWVTIPGGTRSAGYGYLGGPSGGLGFGLRDFWQSCPTRLDIRDADQDRATATTWLWSPGARPMDLRFYHDGLGQQEYADQLEGLEITYEDYEPGFGDPYGIARTHELVLHPYPATPDHDQLADDAAALNDPGLLVAEPARLHAAGVFGDWSLPDRGTAQRARIEDRLEFLIDFYRGQQEDRRWYGFWDYGDVMHSYDPDRHQWRYDVGGFAWDNSELSPDLFWWYQFLRTGRAETFRLAEAMTRHTGEVDVYHAGRFRNLGSRHNVQHWGCSAKQVRISSAVYRRIFYYLTADERTGDLLDELAEAEQVFTAVDPNRKVRPDRYTPDRSALAIGLGTDYSALAAAWLTRWERTGDNGARDKLLGTMSDIGALRHGFLTGEALLDLDTGRFDRSRDRISVSHLSAVFGLVEVCSELINLTHGTDLAQPDFEQAWLQYCRLFLAPAEQQAAEVGQALKGISLVQAHSRLTAWAARWTDDPELAARAWSEFRHDRGDQLNTNPMQRRQDWPVERICGPTVLKPVREARHIGTNGAAQYGLAAIQNLALIGDAIPAD